MKRGKRKDAVRFTRSVLLAAVSSLLAVGAGCVAPPTGIPAVAGTEQEDIPVPETFDLRQSHSPEFAITEPQARFRSWRGEYVGETRVGEVVPWYIREMVHHKWEYKGIDETKDTTLYFEKGDESAEISIFRETDGKAGGFFTIVQAEIHPRGPEEFTVAEHLNTTAVQPTSFKSDKAREPSRRSSASEGEILSSTPTQQTPELDVTELEVIDAADSVEQLPREK